MIVFVSRVRRVASVVDRPIFRHVSSVLLVRNSFGDEIQTEQGPSVLSGACSQLNNTYK